MNESIIFIMGICCTTRSDKVRDTIMSSTGIWYFGNGTVVRGAKSISDCLRKIYNTGKVSTKTFWANQVYEGMYEVQFTPDVFPEVTVMVAASSGCEAATIARRALATDYAFPGLVHVV